MNRFLLYSLLVYAAGIFTVVAPLWVDDIIRRRRTKL